MHGLTDSYHCLLCCGCDHDRKCTVLNIGIRYDLRAKIFEKFSNYMLHWIVLISQVIFKLKHDPYLFYVIDLIKLG